MYNRSFGSNSSDSLTDRADLLSRVRVTVDDSHRRRYSVDDLIAVLPERRLDHVWHHRDAQ